MSERARAALLSCVLLVAACGSEPAAPDPAPAEARPVASQAARTPSGARRADARSSRFTGVRETDCRLLEQNKEEAGFWRRACPGEGGYGVETTEGDLRQNLALIDGGGTRRSLELSRMAEGAFSELGPTLEWRGPPGTPFRPRTLTLRLNAFLDPDRPDRPTSFLAIARLTQTPCIVARIPPGPRQSADARRIADAPALPDCLAG